MSDEVAAAVETSTSQSDPVESSSLPEAAKDFIRELDAEDTTAEQNADEAPRPADPPPATADGDPGPPDKPAAPARPEPARTALSAEQKALIRESYLTEDDVAGMDPAQVDRTLAIIRKRDDKLVRAQRARQAERDDAGRFLPKDQGQPRQPQRHKLSDEYDEEFHKAFNSRDQELDELRAKVAQFDQHFAAQQQQAAAQQHQEIIAWFDDQFSKLGEEFVPVLGKGTARDLDPRSVEWQARDAVVKTAHKLAEAFPDLEPEELFRRAVAANHSDVYANQHRARINGQLLKQSGRRMGAGSSVRAPAADFDPLDPDGKLRDKFQRMLQENGSRA